MAVLYMIIGAYAVILLAVVYILIIADPQTSKVAHFWTVRLPETLWSAAEARLGQKMWIVQWIFDRLLILIYCAVVFGSWSVIFAYVYPWIDSQTYVSRYHKAVGCVVFAACVLSWRYASGSSPGIITKDTLQYYDHFPYDGYMFAPNQKCPTRSIPRLARSKFDRYKYQENIPRFDHFCGWIHNTVGEENYRFFLLFLVVHMGMCVYGTFVLSNLFYGYIQEEELLTATFFNRQTGEEIAAGKFLLFQYLFVKLFPEMVVLVLMAVMSITLGLFLAYHISLTCRGLTTNEAFKWSQIKKWHKTETKRYQQAVKDGLVVPGDNTGESSNKAPDDDDDADVTCTGTQPSSSSSKEEDKVITEEIEDDTYVDPGPPPVNMYNHGLVENWKQVLFPISIRRKMGKNKVM